MKRVVIVGGGISGLALAHRLAELRRQQNAEVEITLLEVQDRFGGVIQTRTQSGFLLEAGPDAFLTERPWASDLCWRLGIGGDLVETNPQFRRSTIVHQGKLVPVPEGLYLVAPIGVGPLLRTPLLSLWGKLRVAYERFIPRRDPKADESVAQFVRRRFGKEALEKIAEPMIGGIYSTDLNQLSLQATLPHFLEMERRYGSVTRGLLAGAGNGVRSGIQQASGPRYALFVSLRDGMEQMVKALVERIASEVLLRRGTEVTRLQFENDRWVVSLTGSEPVRADYLCLTIPSYAAARLLQLLDPKLSSELDQIRYESVATVSFAFPRKDVPHPLDGFGFVVPPREKRRIVGCSFSSVKFPNRAPVGFVLLRAFLGGALDPEIVEMEDGVLEALVRAELRDLLGITAPPSLTAVHRFRQAMPQYEVGHLQRVERIERRVAGWPGLFLIGNAYGGVGIPDCIHQAEQAAERILGAIG